MAEQPDRVENALKQIAKLGGFIRDSKVLSGAAEAAGATKAASRLRAIGAGRKRKGSRKGSRKRHSIKRSVSKKHRGGRKVSRMIHIIDRVIRKQMRGGSAGDIVSDVTDKVGHAAGRVVGGVVDGLWKGVSSLWGGRRRRQRGGAWTPEYNFLGTAGAANRGVRQV
jgi:hypothetical protein